MTDQCVLAVICVYVSHAWASGVARFDAGFGPYGTANIIPHKRFPTKETEENILTVRGLITLSLQIPSANSA
jgi:hypothetical protein